MLCNQTSNIPADAPMPMVHVIRCAEGLVGCGEDNIAAGQCEMVAQDQAEMYLQIGSHVIALSGYANGASVPVFSGAVAADPGAVTVALTRADGSTATYTVASTGGTWSLDTETVAPDGETDAIPADEFAAGALISAVVSSGSTACNALSLTVEYVAPSASDC